MSDTKPKPEHKPKSTKTAAEREADYKAKVAAAKKARQEKSAKNAARKAGKQPPQGTDQAPKQPGPSAPKPMSGKTRKPTTPRPRVKKKRPVERSTPSTASTTAVEAVEGVERSTRGAEYIWEMRAGLDHNFRQVGKRLFSLVAGLFQQAGAGLLRVVDQEPRPITTAKELSPLVIDNIRITVTKNGKYHGQRIPSEVLGDMLRSRHFLGNFPEVKEVVTTPIVLSDNTFSRPGHNAPDAVLYLGPAVTTAQNTDDIHQFLDVMQWASNADRTNAVAALLTVPFRYRFPGGKPLILVTAGKSHSGKGTLVEFIRGKATKVELLYEDNDWPMQKVLHQQLLEVPQAGVINLDNVRTDSSGRAKLIRSGFLESFITTADPVLSSTTGRLRAIRTANHYLVLLNTNEGAVGADLLNRSLPIRLEATGDLLERIARAKETLGGDIKHEWLPAHRERIDAEMWGMIERWVKAGKPLDTAVQHPNGPWAQTIGGILQVNGFTDFLLNYNATRAAADPVREGLGVLAFFAGKEMWRSLDLAKLAIKQGLAKALLPGVDAGNEAACQRAMGALLSPYVGETFTSRTATERISYRLKKKPGRYDGATPHFRYGFEEVKRETDRANDVGGVVLEEEAGPTPLPEADRRHPEEINQPPDPEQYQEVGKDMAEQVAKPEMPAKKAKKGQRA
jgi:hypothetical protein